jgi:mannose-6-phosphate isomerase-like protein (cupin superfamily)
MQNLERDAPAIGALTGAPHHHRWFIRGANRMTRSSPNTDNHSDSGDGQRRWSRASLGDMATTPCPCGQTRRAFTDDLAQTASIHMVDITAEAQTHYHKKLTEIYLILEGEGHMELDGEMVPAKPMDTFLIKPGCRHRAVGRMQIVNIPVPAFDPEDEWFD